VLVFSEPSLKLDPIAKVIADLGEASSYLREKSKALSLFFGVA
jgi:hypothetical protein